MVGRKWYEVGLCRWATCESSVMFFGCVEHVVVEVVPGLVVDYLCGMWRHECFGTARVFLPGWLFLDKKARADLGGGFVDKGRVVRGE